MLKITDLNARIGDKQILNNINITMNPGDVLLVTGHNGSGKSTLLHTIMGRPDIDAGGAITLYGDDILPLECHERAKKGVFMFHQSPPTIDGVNTMTLLNEINNSHDIKLSKRSLIDEARGAFESLGLPADWSKRQFNMGASGGERKKNELAQAELFGGQVLLLDEPDSGLEQASRQRIIDIVNKRRTAGGFVILVTHDKDLQELYKDNKIELQNGTRI